MNNNPNIDLLKWMLEDIRKETLAGVDHLTDKQLFEAPVKGEYPIGSYLMHLAECDIHWLEVLSGIEQPEDLKSESFYNVWFDPSGDASPPDSPINKNIYFTVIEKARKNFLDYISGLNDNILDEDVTLKGKTKDFTFKKKWIIYHIIEHEAHHRGQMFMLIRMAGWNKK